MLQRLGLGLGWGLGLGRHRESWGLFGVPGHLPHRCLGLGYGSEVEQVGSLLSAGSRCSRMSVVGMRIHPGLGTGLWKGRLGNHRSGC